MLRASLFVFIFVIVAQISHFAAAQTNSEGTNTETPASSEGTENASPDTFGDWKITCPQNEKCRMAQSIVTADQKQVILQMRIFKGEEDKKPTALFSFPLGILLNTGWQIKVDNGKSQLLPFEICRVEGCFAGINLPDRLLSSLKRGNVLHVKFFDSKQNPIEPTISLTGFTKAWGELK